MKYTKEERLEIGREIYEGRITRTGAAKKYDINDYTARDYLRLYKASINVDIPKMYKKKGSRDTLGKERSTILDLENMTKEELIDEVIKARVNEERAKKGYLVEGSGAMRKFVPINKQNLK